MSDRELLAIRRKRLRELQRRVASKEKKEEKIDADKVLNRVFKGRAWEVFHSASYQYPEIMNKIRDALVKLVLAGRLSEINGEQLYVFLKSIGLRVKLNTEIRFTDHGKLKSLAEKLREDLRA
jgi:DNA-binding TFAR19-related protein (PDSD5 family)